MTHPLDRLTDLVDGTLTAAERDEVLAHVRGCPRCAGEVAAATAGRDALRALPDIVAPPELGSAAIAEAAEVAPDVTPIREHRATAPRWYRVAAGAGVAAAIVIALAIALPNLGDTPATVTEDTTLGQIENAPAPLTVEVLDQDFDLASVRALADATASQSVPTEASMAAGTGDTQDVGAAIECLTAAFEADPGVPTRLIEARFQGEPAYLGVFLRGPGAGQAADTVQVLVATRPDCRAVSSSQVRLPE